MYMNKSDNVETWIVKLSEDSSLITKAKEQRILEELTTFDWVELIIQQPILGGYFENWDALAPNEWAILLSEMPYFFEKCDKWSEFEPQDWVMLLTERPNLGIYCREWEKFTAEDWVNLLSEQPRFANYCDKWNEYTVEDWEILPYELYDKCPKELLKKIEPHFERKIPNLRNIILRPTFELTRMLYPELSEEEILFKQGFLGESFIVPKNFKIPNGLEEF